MITSDVVAVALVAACKITGCAVGDAFGHDALAKRTRRLAAAGVRHQLGADRPALARIFVVAHTNLLSPSQLTRAAIYTDQIAEVAKALSDAGLGGAAPQPAAPVAAAQPRQGKAACATDIDTRCAEAALSPAAPAPIRDHRSDPTFPRWRGTGVQRLSPRAPLVLKAPERVARLKPVNARILGWSRAYVARGVDTEFLAELFDVHPDALTDALAQPQARAA